MIPSAPTVMSARRFSERSATFSAVLPALCAAAFLCGSALPAAAAGNAAADAVRAAQGTARPEWSATSKRFSEVLTGFGGGDRGAVEHQESLWRGGRGELYGPAVNRTVGCRSASDPECLAVQVLDRGFPERPAIPDDMLAGRDQIVGGLTTPKPDRPGACRDFTFGIPAVKREETCAAGAPFVDHVCRTGWEETVVGRWTRWACIRSVGALEDLTCRIPVTQGSVTQTAYRCRFDGSALAPEREERETTTASASAVFPAVCSAPQKVETKVVCSETLEVSGTPACGTNEEASVTAEGDPQLLIDGCPGFDTMTVTHVCRPEASDARRRLTVTMNGSTKTVSLLGLGKSTLTHPNGVCRAVLQVLSHGCSGNPATACTARVRASVYNGSAFMGEVNALLAYTGWAAGGGGVTDTWTDGCRGLTGTSEGLSR